MSEPVKISVVIVNYNVKEYLEQALLSLQRALASISHEIFVVDNASIDGSVPYIRQRFPEVILLESSENLGFGKANNLALKQISGEYVVLINPDTVVQEDTFTALLDFFEQHPEAAAATCKILNPDGSFSIDCRHNIPTPLDAFWKVIGFSKLFPKSKIFARYHLTYLDSEETYPVPAISGSFMMIKKTVLDEVGYFDERFFMYCEDIDLCARIGQAGHQIWYVPTSQIIHYKGESTKKNNLDYIITFNKALYQFFEKHYANRTLSPFRWLIIAGIMARGVFVYLRNFLREHFPLLLDTLILNIVVLISFMIRMSFKDGFYWHAVLEQYWVIHLISTVFFLGSVFYLQVHPHHRFSIQGVIKANVITFTLLASITFFFKQFGYSRMVVLIAALLSPILMITWRALLKRYFRGDAKAWGKDLFSRPTVIVGSGQAVQQLYQKIRDLKDLSYDLVGIVAVEPGETFPETSQIPVLGHMRNLRELVKIYHIRQIIFASEVLSYEQILHTMNELESSSVEFKIAPSNQEVVIGKSTIDRLDNFPLVDIEYGIGKPFNRMIKRAFDVLLSLLLLIFTLPIALPLLLINRRRIKRVILVQEDRKTVYYHRVTGKPQNAFLNLWLKWWAVFCGNLSFVGAPLNEIDVEHSEDALRLHYPIGLTGLVQINRNKISTPEDLEKYHLFYMKNQSLLLDLEILLRSLMRI
jgi:hypothetical protein